MAGSERRPPDLRDALGSFVQSALEQVGAVREVVERSAQAQRNRYDTAKVERQRKAAMAALGEIVYRKAVRGILGELAENADVRAKLEEIDNLDQRIEAAEQRGASGFGANAGWPQKRPSREGGDREPTRVWRPVPPFAAPESVAPPRGGGIRFGGDWNDDDDDLEEYMHEGDVPADADAATPARVPAPNPSANPKPRKRRTPKRKKAE